jgi:nucleoside-diphosphate-sugar epimerase
LGASGFIGSHLKEHLVKKGVDCYCPSRKDEGVFKRPLGHVVYCIGYTADFRQFPLETAEAHVSVLLSFLKQADFDSFLYVSSTRVYENAQQTTETSNLSVNPNDPNHIFNISKLAGEACCLSVARPEVRIARISNVLGADFHSNNFVNSVIKDILKTGQVTLRTNAEAAKDYIPVNVLVEYLEKIAKHGKERLYNVASGINIRNAQIMEALSQEASFTYDYAPDSSRYIFPPINVKKLRDEFGGLEQDILQQNVLQGVRSMYQQFADYFARNKSFD